MQTLIIGNKSLASHFFELLNNRSFLEMENLWSQNHKFYFSGNAIPLNNKEHLEFINKFFLGFPDFKFIIQDEISEGDRIVLKGKIQATHQANYQGIKATGRKIEINWVDVVEILGGKINNEWFLMDSLSLMHQIGAIPYQINV